MNSTLQDAIAKWEKMHCKPQKCFVSSNSLSLSLSLSLSHGVGFYMFNYFRKEGIVRFDDMMELLTITIYKYFLDK